MTNIIKKDVINSLDLLGPNAIEASAGTGKTYTITGLVIRLLLGDYVTSNQENPNDFEKDFLPLNIEDILVITFTKAATADLKRKIREKISEVKNKFIAYYSLKKAGKDEDFNDKLKDEDDNLVKRLILEKFTEFSSIKKAINLLNIAQKNIDQSAISTIHSFCRSVLERFTTSTLVPKIGSITNNSQELNNMALYLAKAYFYYDKSLTKEEIFFLNDISLDDKDIFESQNQFTIANIDSFNKLIDKEYDCGQFKLNKISGVKDIYKLYKFINEDCFQENAPQLNSIFNELLSSIIQNGWDKVEIGNHTGCQNFWDKLKNYQNNFNLIFTILENKETNQEELKELFDCFINDIKAAISNNNSRIFASLTNGQKFRKFSGELKTLDTQITEIFNGIRKNLSKDFDEGAELPSDFSKKMLQELILTKEVELKENLKQKLNIITTDDLLFKLKYILDTYPTIKEILQKQILSLYPVAIIDEFQDTDPIQFGIFSKIYLDFFSKVMVDKNLKDKFYSMTGFYIVGDPKQSIYSFRNAEINCYLNAVSKITAIDEKRKFTLSTNYRSTKNLVNGVNILFNHALYCEDLNDKANINPKYAQFMKLPFSSSGYANEKKRLILGDNFVPPCELIDIDYANFEGVKKTKDRVSINKNLFKKYNPLICAQKVVELLENGYIEEKGNNPPRKVTFKDIAILVRKYEEYEAIKKEFDKHNLPTAYCSDQNTIDKTPEFDAIKCLMKAVIDNKESKYLRSLLLSKFFVLNAQIFNELLSDENHERILDTLAKCKTLWEKQGFLAMFEFFTYQRGVVFKDKSIKEHLLSFKGGVNTLARLSHCAEVAVFLSAKLNDIKSLIPIFEKLQNRIQDDSPESDIDIDSDLLVKLRLPSLDKVIKVTTFHSSKGLEYNIVFIPFAGTASTGSKTQTKWITPYFDEKEQKRVFDLTASEKSKNGNQEGQENEDVRLFYVAATRAVSAMYLFSVNLNTTNFDLTKTSHSRNVYQKISDCLINRNVTLENPSQFNEKALERALANVGKDLESLDLKLNENPESIFKIENYQNLPSKDFVYQEENQNKDNEEYVIKLLDKDFIDSSWKITSYSAITSGRDTDEKLQTKADDEENDKVDTTLENDELKDSNALDFNLEMDPHDEDLLNNLFILSEDNEANRHSFDKGTNPGTFLHAVYEKINFSEAFKNFSDSAFIVQSEMQFNHIPKYWQLDTSKSEEDNAPFLSICHWIKNTLYTPIIWVGDKDYSLKDIPDAKCAKEMEFLMVISNPLCAKKLNDLVEEYYKDNDKQMYALVKDKRVSFNELRGFLTGFIDLLVMCEGKYYVIDYKSNYIGSPDKDNKITNYTYENMKKAIADHRYDLQFLLYSVALVRFLKQKYGKAYSYNELVGGIRYLFIRGMRRTHIKNELIKEQLGVFNYYLKEEFIEKVDKLLGGK